MSLKCEGVRLPETDDEVRRVFEELGLASSEDRERFNQFARIEAASDEQCVPVIPSLSDSSK